MISISRSRMPLFCFATLLVAACSTPTVQNEKREGLVAAPRESKAAPHILAAAPVSAAQSSQLKQNYPGSQRWL